MELWQLTAREEIRDLVTRYNSNGDSGRFAHVMELRDRLYTGHAEIITIFTGAQQQIRSGESPAYVRHYTATHQIDLIDHDTATGRLYYAVVSPIGLDHWGRYIDDYRCVDGQWRFARRRVTVDGQAADSVMGRG